MNAAIVIGVSQYRKDPKNLNLKFADLDARRFAEALRLPAYRVPEEHLRVLVSTPDAKAGERLSTRAEIEQALEWLRTRPLTAESTVIFYFSGHGLTLGTGGVLAATDFNPQSTTLEGAVDAKWIVDALRPLNVGMVWCVYDMCRPGLAAEDQKRLSDAFELHRDAKSRFAVTMFSTKGGVSRESTTLKSGLFSHFLIDALTPIEAPPRPRLRGMREDRIITPKRVFDYVDSGMRQTAIAEGWDASVDRAGEFQLPEMRWTPGSDSHTGRLFHIKSEDYDVWEDPFERVRPLMQSANDMMDTRRYQDAFNLYIEAAGLLRGSERDQDAFLDIIRRAGDAALAARNPVRAITQYREIVATRPGDRSARLQLASALQHLQRSRQMEPGTNPQGEALQVLQPILAAGPVLESNGGQRDWVHTRAVRLAARLNYDQDRYRDAEILTDAGLLQDPKDVDLLELKARIIRSGIRGPIDPKSPLAAEIGTFFERAIDALVEQRKALGPEVDVIPGVNTQANLDLVRSYERELGLRVELSESFLARRMSLEAWQQLELALKLPVQDSNALNGVRLRLARLRPNPEDALQIYNEVLKADPRTLEALVRRGQIFLDRNELERAEADFLAARQVDAGSTRANLGLARVLMRTSGRELEGQRIFSGVLDTDPNIDLVAIDEYVRYAESRGQVREAARRYPLLLERTRAEVGEDSLRYAQVAQRSARALLLSISLNQSQTRQLASTAEDLLRSVSSIAQNQDRTLYGQIQADYAWALYFRNDLIGARAAAQTARNHGVQDHPVFQLLR